MSKEAKPGLQALLTPEESVVVLIDHQPFQFANLHSHEPTMIVNNVTALAKATKVFDVPTILTTVLEERGGYLIKGLQDVLPEQKPINRTLINTWEDERVVDAVKATGRKKLITAGLWTEICVAIPPVLGEWQRDWAREKTVPGTVEVQAQHGGASGIAFSWETQLLTVGDGSEV
ncbi:isochorismatase family protein [Streptomyces sp. NPDC102462]|uniref:isochorismatase family protein n=1 Tax=Streptomyces sp. NPDC102462 TaxID=3366178 RepID=UPI0037FAEB53